MSLYMNLFKSYAKDFLYKERTNGRTDVRVDEWMSWSSIAAFFETKESFRLVSSLFQVPKSPQISVKILKYLAMVTLFGSV